MRVVVTVKIGSLCLVNSELDELEVSNALGSHTKCVVTFTRDRDTDVRLEDLLEAPLSVTIENDDETATVFDGDVADGAREHFVQFIQRLGQSKHSPTLIFVTHHVEEIMPVFSHVLLLKDGTVLAAGKKAETLNSGNLSAAFSVRMKLKFSQNRYALSVPK